MPTLDNRTEKRRTGDLGENLACEFLRRRGFKIVDRNYLRKWGELDIVAKKQDIIHFIEVKTVRVMSLEVSNGGGDYRPEDNMHPGKLARLSRTIQTYLMDKNLDSDFQLDLITVKIDEGTRRGRVELIENVII